MASLLPISIPQPCAQPWAAMVPTAAGRHCGACRTEVVDFTRLSEVEILAFLARRGSRPVCILANPAQLAAPAPAAPWRRWLLAGLALLGWQPVSSCATKPPQQLPAQAAATAAADPTAAPDAQLRIRGQVFDGASQTPVPQVSIFLNGTEFGTVTDAEGRFELVLARTWAPIAGGTVELRFVGNPFDFLEQTLKLSARAASPKPLVVRMVSIPNRGQVMGKMRMPELPVKPPVK